MRTIATAEQVAAWFPSRSAEVEWKAAEAWVAARVRWPQTSTGPDGAPVELEPPADLVLAVKILTTRFIERRNTPTGVIGMDDLGAVRMPGVDQDVKTLIGPWRPVVFG